MKALQYRFLYSVVLSLLLCSASYTLSQGKDEELIEEIIITGSRIKQNPLEARTPVQTLSKEDLQRSGKVSLADFMQRLPISGSAINKTNNSSGNLGFPPDGAGIGAGAAEIDLRYLQSKRVLVLVDGRRWIRGSSASGVSGAVDLNTIPSNAIKSIEVLQDGASAVYGTDAIGGVVNIITQDNYNSFKASAYYSEYAGEGDAQTTEYDIAWGSSSENSRLFIDISFTDQGGARAGDRDISAVTIPGASFSGASSGTPDGRFLFTDPRTGTDVNVSPNTQLPVFDLNDPASGDFREFTNDDRFNFNPFNFIVTPNKRVNIFSKAEYDLDDKSTLRLLASYNNRESRSQAAPEPIFFGPDGDGGFYMENVFWPADHPFNPFGVDLGPDEIVFFARRPLEAGPRIFDQNVDTFYLSTGIDSSFAIGERDISWDATLTWAQNQANQVKNGAFNGRNIALAMGPVDACAAALNCVPINIVGEGSLTQEMLDFVTFKQKDESKQELFNAAFNVTGNLGGLPAGDIGWALGVEHREEEGAFIPDSIVSSGETAGVPASPTDGRFEVDEIYGELVIPLLADTNLARSLDVSAAFRWSDYDLFDSDTVGKIGLSWAPSEDFLIRANFSEGLRAPNIGELFNTGSRFDATINDPCSTVSPENAANCAALGVPPGFEQPNPQLGVDTGGNPDLEPETSETFTIGFAWNAAMLTDNWDFTDTLTVELNYYDIEIEDAIQAPNAQDLLNGCVTTLSPVFCDPITRSVNGTVTGIEGQLSNIGGIETSGWDLSVRMDTATYRWGRLGFEWVSTFLNDYFEITQGADGEVRVDRAGTELGSPERGFVETKSTLHTDWHYGDWDLRLSLRYLSSLDEECAGLAGDFELFELCSDGEEGNKMDSRTYVDTQLSWSPSNLGDGNWSLQVGADNLFDEEPPLCYSCDLNSFDGTLYPIPGTVVYARINYRR